MAVSLRWQDPEGISVINAIVSKCIPCWTSGLRPHQLDAIIRILDGRDLLYCVATGQGKSAMFTVPLLVHWELYSSPQTYLACKGSCYRNCSYLNKGLSI